jgi:predicted alpha-1,6-mannanase (GH76 family)
MATLSAYRDPAGGYDPGPRWFWFGGGARKYDDNIFVALDLLEAYRITGSVVYLHETEADARYVESGWSTRTSLPHPGGEYWEDPHFGTDRNAVTTGGAALLDAQLLEVTGRTSYRSWAVRDLRWLFGTLTVSDGLLADHISSSGAINAKVWSYNQGLAIGAWVTLYSTTHRQEYLRSAVALAQRALSYFRGHGLVDQTAPFNAVFFDYLMELDRVSPDAGYRAALESYATYLYDHMDHADGVVHLTGFDGQPSQLLIAQAAAVRVFDYLAATSTSTATSSATSTATSSATASAKPSATSARSPRGRRTT